VPTIGSGCLDVHVTCGRKEALTRSLAFGCACEHVCDLLSFYVHVYTHAYQAGKGY
jgi:hypothetical protein